MPAHAADSVPESTEIHMRKSSRRRGAAASSIDIGISKQDRAAIAAGLSGLLADTCTLYLTTHNCHWNVTGPMFNSLQERRTDIQTLHKPPWILCRVALSAQRAARRRWPVGRTCG